MTIDKQQLQKLLWAEAASFRADCADWKRNTEALDEFLGEKTVVEVALELLAENERVKARLCVCRDCDGQGEVYSGHSSYQGHNQPPEPDMDVCGTCGGDGVLGPLEDFEALVAERDQLKAENETLIAAAQALRDEWRKDQADAKRHRFARDCAYGALTLMEGKRVFVELDYPSGEFSGCDQAYDAAIDAAMGKGEQS